VLGVICLRRRKNERIHGKPILELPTKTRHQDSVREVELKGHERKLYETLELHCKTQFKSLLNKSDEGDAILSNYAFVLEMLLRMRQACDHPKLV
jgi:SNF2 family DNA or RNA helicase